MAQMLSLLFYEPCSIIKNTNDVGSVYILTELEKKISFEIDSYKSRVKVFWDMDGTFVSMDMCNLNIKNDPGFFYTKRPINSMLRIVKRFFDLGAETYILSFCGYNYQKADKMRWLNEYCGFIKKENIIIIPRKEDDVKVAESKQYLKAEYIKDYITDNDIVYMIDDNESVLLGTKSKLPQINIVSPIDFIE